MVIITFIINYVLLIFSLHFSSYVKVLVFTTFPRGHPLHLVDEDIDVDMEVVDANLHLKDKEKYVRTPSGQGNHPMG